MQIDKKEKKGKKGQSWGKVPVDWLFPRKDFEFSAFLRKSPNSLSLSNRSLWKITKWQTEKDSFGFCFYTRRRSELRLLFVLGSDLYEAGVVIVFFFIGSVTFVQSERCQITVLCVVLLSWVSQIVTDVIESATRFRGLWSFSWYSGSWSLPWSCCIIVFFWA